MDDDYSVHGSLSTFLVELGWFADYKREQEEREALRRLKDQLDKKTRREARLKKMKEEGGSGRWRGKRKVSPL